MGAAQSAPPTSLANKQPFKRTAISYFESGWLPLPLPPKRKEEPPTGFTGWNPKKKVTLAVVRKWQSSVADGSNICARARDDYVGIDVDLYKGDAEEQWDAIIAEMGELPDTWTSSARSDGSGIRHYRLPEGYTGLAWPGTVGDAIQFVHTGHRYALLPPSRHPSEVDANGKPAHYQWYEPGDEVNGDGIVDGSFPAYDELTELPVKWIHYFTEGKFAKHLPEKNLGSPTKAKKIVAAWIAERDGEPCAKMLRALDELTEQFDANAAHDTMLNGIYRLASLSCEGHAGLSAVISRLHDDFLVELKREGRGHTARGAAEAEEEWLRARDAGVKKIMVRLETGEFEGHYCECSALDAEGRPRPAFNVTNYDITAAMPDCYRALAATEANGWFGAYNRSGNMVLMSRHGLRAANVPNLRGSLARVTDWLRPGGDGPPAKANPPRDILESLVADETMPDYLPELRGVMHTPFYARVDGKPVLINENGYHPDVKILLRMDPEMEETVAKVDQAPSPTYVKRAKELIWEMLRDFPFVGSADQATAYAALLLPFVRDLITGGTPLHLVEAPIAGTGKGLLTEAIALVSCGALSGESGFQRIAVTDDRNRNVEMVKEMNARMRLDPRVLVLDNVNQKLDSGALASALTSETYQVRVLGGDESAQSPNRALWMATANNLSASPEMRRRILVCRLDAGVERPAERGGFKHEDLLVWVERNRAGLVWACLTLVANWVVAGCPLDHKTKMGSFEGWVSVMAGLLAANDIPGLLTNREEFAERAGSEGATIEALVHEWWSTHKGERVSAKDLALCSAVTEMFGEDVRGVDLKLGRLLTASNGQVIGDFKIHKTVLDGRPVYFLAEKDGPQTFKTRRRARKSRR
jgi:Bifunctional DNA primase/polymerase, N-terminal